jgi:hypothetical protein
MANDQVFRGIRVQYGLDRGDCRRGGWRSPGKPASRHNKLAD